MPVREYDQISTRDFDLVFLAFDLKPALSPGNRVKPPIVFLSMLNAQGGRRSDRQ